MKGNANMNLQGHSKMILAYEQYANSIPEYQYQILHTMPYQEYLSTVWWKFIREYFLAWFGNKCQVCNSDGKVNVHHRTYENRGREHITDLILLCKECHELYHFQPVTKYQCDYLQ